LLGGLGRDLEGAVGLHHRNCSNKNNIFCIIYIKEVGRRRRREKREEGSAGEYTGEYKHRQHSALIRRSIDR
jgi:hypothetical protein